MRVVFSDGTYGKVDLTFEEHMQLLEFVRRGFRVYLPVEYQHTVTYVNIIDLNTNVRRRQNESV